jgi:hypothetical protein
MFISQVRTGTCEKLAKFFAVAFFVHTDFKPERMGPLDNWRVAAQALRADQPCLRSVLKR